MSEFPQPSPEEFEEFRPENQEPIAEGAPTEMQHDMPHVVEPESVDSIEVQTGPQNKAEVMDESGEAFHNRVGQLISDEYEIVTFRGAGTKNGIAPEDLQKAVGKITEVLQRDIESGKKVAIMFDGDEDNREKPDIGAVFGMVADTFKDNPNVVAIAAQQQSWYYPKAEGGVLESATGTPYETFVFPDSTPGGHAALTQSKDLAQYHDYKQVFVGPAGAIAADQLRDLNEKADGHKASVLAIATHNNPNLTQEFKDKAKAAFDADDMAKVQGFMATLKQREDQPFGMMYGADSYKTILTGESGEFPNLQIDFDEDIVPEFQEMRSKPLKETYMDEQKAETLAPFLYSDEKSELGFMPGYGHTIDEIRKDWDKLVAEGKTDHTSEEVGEMVNGSRDRALEPVERLYDVNPDLFASMPTKEFIEIARELNKHKIEAGYINEWEVEPAQRKLAEAQAELAKAEERFAAEQRQQEDIIANYRPKESESQ